VEGAFISWQIISSYHRIFWADSGTGHVLPYELLISRVGNKKPIQKTRPIKPKKNLPKNHLKAGFLGFIGFLKTDIYFWCKSQYFSCKMSLEES
jgi:hypothetical protein